MITEAQGFEAMRKFLESYWRSRGEGDELRFLLSSMDNSFNPNGKPLDIALWEARLVACEEVKKEGIA